MDCHGCWGGSIGCVEIFVLFVLFVFVCFCLFCRNLFLVLVYVVTAAFVFRDHHWHGVVSMEYVGSFEECIGVVWGRKKWFGGFVG